MIDLFFKMKVYLQNSGVPRNYPNTIIISADPGSSLDSARRGLGNIRERRTVTRRVHVHCKVVAPARRRSQ